MLKPVFEKLSTRLLGAVHRWVEAVMPAPRETSWIHRLEALGGELEKLNGSTEHEFLAIGESLQDFYLRAKEISKSSSSVAGLMSGGEIAKTIRGFHSIQERVQRLEGESKQGAQILREIVQLIAAIQSRLSGFNHVIRELRTLCISTKIEGARLGDRDLGFGALSEDVKKLDSEIADKCTHLLAQSEMLNLDVGRTLDRVLDLEAKRQDQAGIILEKTRGSRDSLREKFELSSTGAMSIAFCYESVSRSIGEIVTSMQFHDITRQRIEHVIEALGSLGLENARDGMPSLPFYKAELKSLKPLSHQYPRTLATLGDHLRRKRLELKLLQKDIAKMLGTDIDTVSYWETNRTGPSLAFLPKIIEFLGYVPLSILPEEPERRIAFYRKLMRLSQEKLARRLGVDPGTLGKWERGRLLSSELDEKISTLFMEVLHRFGGD